jgi:hypothetical protein
MPDAKTVFWMVAISTVTSVAVLIVATKLPTIRALDPRSAAPTT